MEVKIPKSKAVWAGSIWRGLGLLYSGTQQWGQTPIKSHTFKHLDCSRKADLFMYLGTCSLLEVDFMSHVDNVNTLSV